MTEVFSDVTDDKLIALLQLGCIGVIPTDTLYGVVCVASKQESVERLYALKKRENKPGTIIAASIEHLTSLGLKKRYLTAVEQYWSGAVSIVIPTSDSSTEYLSQGASGLAVRVVANKKLVKLLNQTGPLMTSSANQPGESPANTIKEAKVYFGGEVDFYVDGGDLSNNKPSTIIRVVDDAVEVIRPGAVKIDEASGSIVS